MRALGLILLTTAALMPLVCPAVVLAQGAAARWVPQRSGTTAEFRGLSAASASVVWAGGRGGVYTRTVDGGANWIVQHESRRPGVFFDGMAFWDAEHGVAFSDPVDGAFLIVRTADGGATWTPVPPENIPAALPGEAGFAASGTGFAARAVGGTGHVWIGTGGGRVARVFRSVDGGRTWSVAETPLPASASAGIFGIAFRDALHGVAVGGDYLDREGAALNVLQTVDGGASWTVVGRSAPAGVRYGAVYVPGTSPPLLVAVGPSGSGYSRDDGASWTAIGAVGYNTVTFVGPDAGWAAGVDGRIARWQSGS